MDSLKPHDVHVWYLWPERVVNNECLSRHVQILSNDERARAQTFRFEEDRNLHLLSKAFVRIVLSRYAAIDPSLWVFKRNQYGKPEILDPAGAEHIAFNISHTTGLIAGVFAMNSAVGIDAEYDTRSVDVLSIAQRYLAPGEYSDLSKLEDPERRQRFLEYWTLKEAYAKANGLGMSMDLSRFSFDIHDDAPRISFRAADSGDPEAWSFRLLKPDPHHTVAVAIRSFAEVDLRFSVNDGSLLMQ